MKPSIEVLKTQWLADPCWDIETTEGFEAHHDELLIFRLTTERDNYRKRLTAILSAWDALKKVIG